MSCFVTVFIGVFFCMSFSMILDHLWFVLWLFPECLLFALCHGPNDSQVPKRGTFTCSTAEEAVEYCLLCCAVARARKLEPRQLLKFWTSNSYRKSRPAWNHHPTAFSFAFVDEMVLTWCEVDSGSPLWQPLFL